MLHFDRAVYWIKKLKPDADDAYLVASIGHDIERVFREAKKDFVNTKLSFRDEEFLKQHSEKGAEILSGFLKEEGADSEFIKKVKLWYQCTSLEGMMIRIYSKMQIV